jgi:hypothetical protein
VGFARRRESALPTIVESISWSAKGAAVVVRKAGDLPSSDLRKIGGRRDWIIWSYWTFTAKDEVALAKLLGALRDLRVAFLGAGPPGWTPGEVFADLRDRGLLHGTFRSITWRGPGAWEIEET